MKTLLNKEYDRNKIIEQMTKEIFSLPISGSRLFWVNSYSNPVQFLPISAQGTFDPQIYADLRRFTQIKKMRDER